MQLATCCSQSLLEKQCISDFSKHYLAGIITHYFAVSADGSLEVFMQGLIALASNSAFLLGLHVILGAMLGAALGAHNENVFMQQEFK